MRQIKVKSITPLIEIGGDEAKHLILSQRAKVGEKLIVVDETGNRAIIELTKFTKDKVNGKVVKNLAPLKPELVTLAVSIPKRDFDVIIRQATEIGVKAIQPIMTVRSVARPSDLKADRWRRIAKEAAEQSGSKEPIILPLVSLTECLQQSVVGKQIVFCNENEEQRRIRDVQVNGELTLIIGCEGGFTEEELTMMQEIGAVSVSLGKNILRVDTAAIAALAIIKSLCD